MGFAYFAADWVDMDWTAMMSVVAVAFDGGEERGDLVFCLFSCGLRVGGEEEEK